MHSAPKRTLALTASTGILSSCFQRRISVDLPVRTLLTPLRFGRVWGAPGSAGRSRSRAACGVGGLRLCSITGTLHVTTFLSRGGRVRCGCLRTPRSAHAHFSYGARRTGHGGAARTPMSHSAPLMTSSRPV
eukprot:783820-Prymnesium_polylepis.1